MNKPNPKFPFTRASGPRAAWRSTVEKQYAFVEALTQTGIRNLPIIFAAREQLVATAVSPESSSTPATSRG